MPMGSDRCSKLGVCINLFLGVVVSVKGEVSALIKLSHFLTPKLPQTLPNDSAHPSAYRSPLSGCRQKYAWNIPLKKYVWVSPQPFFCLFSSPSSYFIMSRACSGRCSILLLVNTPPCDQWQWMFHSKIKLSWLHYYWVRRVLLSRDYLIECMSYLLLILDLLEKLTLMSNL